VVYNLLYNQKGYFLLKNTNLNKDKKITCFAKIARTTEKRLSRHNAPTYFEGSIVIGLKLFFVFCLPAKQEKKDYKSKVTSL
jgi:hypothetical protein